MPIPVISKIVQRNNGTFKLMDAKNVAYKGQENVSIEDKIDAAAKKYMYFIMTDVLQGPQTYECLFPFDGTILSVSAICTVGSNEEVHIDIEKADMANRAAGNWTSVLDTNDKLVIHTDGSQTYTVSDPAVNRNDIFRINILNNVYISSLTINIEVSI